MEMEGGGEGCTCAGGRVDWWEVVEGVGLVRISFTSYRKQGVKIKPVPFLQPHTRVLLLSSSMSLSNEVPTIVKSPGLLTDVPAITDTSHDT